MKHLQLSCAVSAGTLGGWLYVEAWLEAAPPKAVKGALLEYDGMMHAGGHDVEAA